MKTIKEATEALKISRQTLYNRINKINGFDKYIKKDGRRTLITAEGLNILANYNPTEHVNNAASSDADTSVNSLSIDVLADQLSAKDEQIANLQRALDQQQQLQLQTMKENSDLREQLSITTSSTNNYTSSASNDADSSNNIKSSKDHQKTLKNLNKYINHFSKSKSHWWQRLKRKR